MYFPRLEGKKASIHPQVPPPPPRVCLFCADIRQSSSPPNRLCRGWMRSAFFRFDKRSVGATLKNVGAASTSHYAEVSISISDLA